MSDVSLSCDEERREAKINRVLIETGPDEFSSVNLKVLIFKVSSACSSLVSNKLALSPFNELFFLLLDDELIKTQV